jgi:hypothetical protein
MNPVEILTNKLLDIGIPQDAVNKINFESIVTNINNPDKIKTDLINQLSGKIGLDKTMITGAINNIDIVGLFTNHETVNSIMSKVFESIEPAPLEKISIWQKIKNLFGL